MLNILSIPLEIQKKSYDFRTRGLCWLLLLAEHVEVMIAVTDTEAKGQLVDPLQNFLRHEAHRCVSHSKGLRLHFMASHLAEASNGRPNTICQRAQVGNLLSKLVTKASSSLDEATILQQQSQSRVAWVRRQGGQDDELLHLHNKTTTSRNEVV